MHIIVLLLLALLLPMLQPTERIPAPITPETVLDLTRRPESVPGTFVSLLADDGSRFLTHTERCFVFWQRHAPSIFVPERTLCPPLAAHEIFHRSVRINSTSTMVAYLTHRPDPQSNGSTTTLYRLDLRTGQVIVVEHYVSADGWRVPGFDYTFHPTRPEMLVYTGIADYAVDQWYTFPIDRGLSDRQHGFNILRGRTVNQLAFSPDGQWLLVSYSTFPAYLWNLTSDAPPRALNIVSNNIIFSPDSRYMVVAWLGGSTLQLWDVEYGEQVFRWTQTTGSGDMTFNHAGTLLASGSLRGTLHVYSVSTGTLLLLLPQQAEDMLTSLAFSPDDRLLVTTASDRSTTLDLYGLATTLSKHTTHFYSVSTP